MAPAKKINTLSLDWSILDHVRVLAVQSPLLPLHRLAYFLNEKTGWNLSRTADYVEMPENAASPENAAQEGFALLQHPLPEERLHVFLLDNQFSFENKPITTLVSGKNATIDYFLLICGEGAPHFDLKALSDMIESIESVFSVHPIDIQSCDPLKQFVLVHQDCFLEF